MTKMKEEMTESKKEKKLRFLQNKDQLDIEN